MIDKQNTLKVLLTTLHFLKSQKPNNRSDDDRRMAIVITEMEQVVAYFYAYVVDPPSFGVDDNG